MRQRGSESRPRGRRLRGLASLAACLLLVPLVWMGCSGCGRKGGAGVGTGDPPDLRVRLLADASRVQLKATQPPVIRVGSGAAQRLNVPANVPVHINREAGGWKIGALKLGAGDLFIEPQPDGSVHLDKNAYHGSFRLVPTAGSAFDVVNHVNVDAYLKGVLARELFPEFLPEAYKAQAIVARTYALYETRVAPKARAWDVYADTKSQVYGGISGESEKSRLATDETVGVVVAHGPPGQEKIFKAYFSACCGGAGQSAADAFGDVPSEPLTERAVGTLCAEAPRFTWRAVAVPKDELTRRFKAFGSQRQRAERNIDRIERVEVFQSNAVGRPTQFLVTDLRRQKYLLSGEELRWAVNTDAPEGSRLYSSFVRPSFDANAIRFDDGHGFGHGVGMCQWCAQAQAKKGVKHEDIVLSAYKGSKLVRAY